MKAVFRTVMAAALLAGAALFLPGESEAGSCCGGGGGVSLMVPKYARAVVDLSFDTELYDGFWNEAGRHVPDPPGSDLRQYRLNLGYGHRFGEKWQASVSLPYVWNNNTYSGISSATDGPGDITLSGWYEALDDVTAWKRPKSLPDLVPSVTLGLSLLLPTGISLYDDVESSFDITGRGFYRLDGTLLVDKTIHPWSASLQLGYGTHFERTVNREYGRWVEPYDKRLGDRFSASLAVGYRHFLGTGGDTLTGTLSYSYLQEEAATVEGRRDTSSQLMKQAIGLALAYSSLDHDWSVRTSWSHALSADGWGENFPTTDVIGVGVRYAFR